MKNVELVSLRQQLTIAKQAVKDLPKPQLRSSINNYNRECASYKLSRARLSSDVIRIDKLISQCISNNLNK